MDADGLSGCVQLEGFSVGEEDCGMMGGNCGQRLFSTRPHRVSADSCWFFRSRSSPFSVVLSTHVWQGSLELNKTSRVSFALCTSYPLCINRSCLPLFSTRVFHAKSTILREHLAFLLPCVPHPLCINRSCLPLFSTRVFHAKSTILRFPSPAVLDFFYHAGRSKSRARPAVR